MERDLKIEFDWLGREAGVSVELATYAAVSIDAGGHLATLVEDTFSKSVRPVIHVSAYHLATWLAMNWWRLRWEPPAESSAWHLSHNLASIGGGYLWPNLAFSSDGESVLIESRSSNPSGTEPIRYLNTFAVSVGVDVFERELMAFVEAVVARLAQMGFESEEELLGTLWIELTKERSESEFTRWRRLEALLGFDTDEGPETLLTSLHDLAQEVGEAAMEEVAAASKQDALQHLHQLWNETRKQATRLKVEEFPAHLSESLHIRENEQRTLPWQRGEVLAREIRGSWGLSHGPVSNRTLSDLFGITEDFFTGVEGLLEVPIPAGFRNGQPGELEVAINKKHPNGRRFALARIIGDFLNPEVQDRLFPVTDTRTARQKLQRAFAQEFLCPFEDLEACFGSRSPSDEEIDDAASYFEVSPLLVRTTLVNKGVLERTSLVE